MPIVASTDERKPMNRRDFLKALSAITGCAALPAGLVAALPEEIDDGYVLTLHDKDGTEVARQSCGNLGNEICFPMSTTALYITSLFAVHTPSGRSFGFPLDKPVWTAPGTTPRFPAGTLSVTLD